MPRRGDPESRRENRSSAKRRRIGEAASTTSHTEDPFPTQPRTSTPPLQQSSSAGYYNTGEDKATVLERHKAWRGRSIIPDSALVVCLFAKRCLFKRPEAHMSLCVSNAVDQKMSSLAILAAGLIMRLAGRSMLMNAGKTPQYGIVQCV